MLKFSQDEWKKVQERTCDKCVFSKKQATTSLWDCTRLRDNPLVSFVSPVTGYMEYFNPKCLREREYPVDATFRDNEPREHERCGWEGKFFTPKESRMANQKDEFRLNDEVVLRDGKPIAKPITDVAERERSEPRPSYCCQKCGEPIGWLGRFLMPFLHRCRKK